MQNAEKNSVNIFFYFCSYLGDSTASSSRLLRSLTAQIIQKHQDLALYIHDNYAQSYPVPSRKALLGLLPELLRGLGSVRFVIDGIDEWDEREQKDLLTDLTQILLTDSASYICKVLVSSRDTLEISRSLRKNKATVSISLSDSDEGLGIHSSIRRFIDNKLSDLPDYFPDLDPNSTILAQVKHTILEKSHGKALLFYQQVKLTGFTGMFLWVRLVLDLLQTVYSPEHLRSLVEDLPSDLETLYGRILRRICNAPGTEKYGGVQRILSWICFSQRPLHKLEILHGLVIPPSHRLLDAQSVPIPQILDHCKPFIEERPDSTIAFVHFTVQEYEHCF